MATQGQWFTRKLLTTKQVRKKTGLSDQGVRQLRESGAISFKRFGKRYLHDEGSVIVWMTEGLSTVIPQKKIVVERAVPISLKGGTGTMKLRWQTEPSGRRTRANAGDFVIIEDKGEKMTGRIHYYMDFWDGEKRTALSLAKLARKHNLGPVTDRASAFLVARKARNLMYQAQENPEKAEKEDISFAEFAEVYLKARNGKKASSFKTVRAQIEGSLVPFFGDFKLSDLSLKLTAEYVEHCRKSGIQDSTIGNYLTAFGSMISWAERYDYSVKRKSKIIHMKDYSLQTNKRKRELEPDEEKRLFKVANPFWKDLLTFALHTGMRLGNICSLRWSWIDFDSKTIIVPSSEAKAGKDIVIYLNPTVVKLLRHMHEANGQRKHVFMRKVNSHGIKPMIDRWVQAKFNQLTKDAGIWKDTFINKDGDEVYIDEHGEEEKYQNLHFHDLRRSFAKRLVRKGVDVLTLKGCMGHSDINSTMAYVEEDPERVKEAFNLLDME